MLNKQKKRLMTDVAKGKITMKEADNLINPKKVEQDTPEDEIEAEVKPIIKKTQTRKLNPKKILKKKETSD